MQRIGRGPEEDSKRIPEDRKRIADNSSGSERIGEDRKGIAEIGRGSKEDHRGPEEDGRQ